MASLRYCLMAAAAGVAVMVGSGAALALDPVTVFGSTDAQECYFTARNGISTDTDECDMALRASKLSPREYRATLVNRGIIHNRGGRLELALKDFNEALEGDPDLAEARLNRGNSYFLARRFKDALTEYEAALADDVDDPHLAWYNIGLVHQALKDTEAAIIAYRKCLEIEPDFKRASEKLALLKA